MDVMAGLVPAISFDAIVEPVGSKPDRRRKAGHSGQTLL